MSPFDFDFYSDSHAIVTLCVDEFLFLRYNVHLWRNLNKPTLIIYN